MKLSGRRYINLNNYTVVEFSEEAENPTATVIFVGGTSELVHKPEEVLALTKALEKLDA